MYLRGVVIYWKLASFTKYLFIFTPTKYDSLYLFLQKLNWQDWILHAPFINRSKLDSATNKKSLSHTSISWMMIFLALIYIKMTPDNFLIWRSKNYLSLSFCVIQVVQVEMSARAHDNFLNKNMINCNSLSIHSRHILLTF